MKIYADARKSRSGEDELAEKVAEVMAQFEPAQEKRIRDLAEVLQAHTPLFYLRAMPAVQIADWVREIYRFIDSRRQDIAIRHLPLDQAGRSLLATNTPDAPFLLDSLQNFLLQQESALPGASPIRFSRSGAVPVKSSTLAGKAGKGGRESLILLEIDGMAADAGEEIARGAEKILQKVLQVHRDSRPSCPGAERPRSRKRRWSLRATSGNGCRRGISSPFPIAVCWWRRTEKGRLTIQEEEGKRLGLSPDPQELSCCRQRPLTDFSAALQARIARPGVLVVEEIDRQSPLHRVEPLVYLGFREGGRTVGGSTLFSASFRRKASMSWRAMFRRCGAASNRRWRRSISLRVATITEKQSRSSIRFQKSNCFSWRTGSWWKSSVRSVCCTGTMRLRWCRAAVWRSMG